MTIIDPNAAEKLRAAIEAGKLKAGTWGDGNSAVCMMSAMVSGADRTEACVTAGWPRWLVDLNVYLFDATVGAEDEEKARAEFALRIAELVQTPRDYDKARDLFLIRRLDDGEYSALKSLRMNPVDADWWRDCEAEIMRVADLLRGRVSGEDVAKEMDAAAADATRAARAARATRATRATRAAAEAAARAARYAAVPVSFSAVPIARAVAEVALYASGYDARVARADLITALEGAAQIKGDE